MTNQQHLAGLAEAKRAAWRLLYEAVTDMDRLSSTISFLNVKGPLDQPIAVLVRAQAEIARSAASAMAAYLDMNDRISDVECKLGKRIARAAVKLERETQKQKPALVVANKVARRSRKAAR